MVIHSNLMVWYKNICLLVKCASSLSLCININVRFDIYWASYSFTNITTVICWYVTITGSNPEGICDVLS